MGIRTEEVVSFREAFQKSGVTSIDAFLEHRKEFLDIGKIAIAENLIPFENEENLFPPQNDWYGYLLDRLNARPDEFQYNKLTVITFNYDRSLEWYLFTALQNRFGLEPNKVIELLSFIPIIHVHGNLGNLPWINQGRAFTTRVAWTDVKVAREKIKIIHENIEHDHEFYLAQEAFKSAEIIIFLGFGYNRTNLKRLGLKTFKNVRIIGSAFGLTEREQRTAYSLFRSENTGARTFGNSDWDVLKFLREMIDLEDNKK